MIALLVEIMFFYKTNLLTTIEICQILSYTYYLSIKLSQNTQRAALLLYVTNFAFFIRPFSGSVSTLLPPKFQSIGKTGYFLADSFGVHICILIAGIILFGIKVTASKFNTMKKLFNKVNPYLLTYVFRLVFL